MNRPFGGDHSELGQVPAERVDGLRALANQQVPRAEHDGGGLLVRALEGHKAHGGALSGLADGLGIGHVVLLPLDERLHVRRRDETDRMAELGDLAPPVVGARTRLQGHRAGRERGQEREELAAAQRLAKDHRARAVSPMELKDVLGEIQSDGAHRVHGRLLEWPATPSLWHTTAAGGVHTFTAAGDAAERLLARMLDGAHEAGLLKARGRQRTDSTHVLAAVRALNRLELLAETRRAALNAIAGVAPDWLRGLAPPEWHERYDRRVEDRRLPKTEPQRDAYVAQVGTDGFLLLNAIDGADAPPAIAALPAVAVLRRVWARHFEQNAAGPDNDGTNGGGVRLRPAQGRGPGDRIESPYDSEARFRTKAGTSWTGYMVHLTETCDAGAPRLVVHADTTPANVHEAMRTAPIHEALAAKGLAPSEHLVDAGYVSAEHLVGARERHGIDL